MADTIDNVIARFIATRSDDVLKAITEKVLPSVRVQVAMNNIVTFAALGRTQDSVDAIVMLLGALYVAGYEARSTEDLEAMFKEKE